MIGALLGFALALAPASAAAAARDAGPACVPESACLGRRQLHRLLCGPDGARLPAGETVDCPRGCENGACRPTRPSALDRAPRVLALLYPNGGDVLHPGARVKVGWISKAARGVSIWLKLPSGPRLLARLPDSAAPGAAVQTALVAVPADLPPGDAALVLSGEGGLADESYEAVTIAERPRSAEAEEETGGPSSDVDEPAYALAARPDDVAVVIGVERYAAVGPALYAERDAKAVRAHLRALGVADRRVKLLTGERATLAGLEAALETWLPTAAKPGGRVFVYFAGHGAPDGKGRAFLLPWDGDPSYLGRTAYPLQRLYERLEALRSGPVFLILDSCFSGAGGRSVLARGARPLTNVRKPEAGGGRVLTLAAAAADQISGTVEEQRHGSLTYHVLKGLSRPGRLTAQELFDYAAPLVEDDAARDNRAQTPQLIGADKSLVLRD